MATALVTRPVTVHQWARALDRALEDALDVYVEPISGEAFVESATTPGVLYHVGASFCTCPAGARGIACKHRACYLSQIGELPIEAPAPVSRRCSACAGVGKVEEWGVSEPIGCKPCDVCGGSGVDVRPAPIRPHGAPALQPVAAIA